MISTKDGVSTNKVTSMQLLLSAFLIMVVLISLSWRSIHLSKRVMGSTFFQHVEEYAEGEPLYIDTPSSLPSDATSTQMSSTISDQVASSSQFDVSSTSLSISTSTYLIPVLTYHRIRPYKLKDSKSARSYITTPEVFEAELQYLHDNHYSVISVDDLLLAFKGKPLPEKPVVLTFDDGYKEQYTYAFPLLEKYHDTATFFIYTNAVSNYGDFMTWDEVVDLHAKGMTIAAHTKSHPKLTKEKTKEKIIDEVLGSKKILEQKISAPVVYFAYPYGLYNSTVESVIMNAGFEAAFGLQSGKKQSYSTRFTLHRTNMGSSLESFKEAIQ